MSNEADELHELSAVGSSALLSQNSPVQIHFSIFLGTCIYRIREKTILILGLDGLSREEGVTLRSPEGTTFDRLSDRC